MTVFDRRLVRQRRERAAAGWDGFDFLIRETADRLVERLDDIARTFPVALDLGCHGGEVASALDGRGGIETLIQADLAPAMVRRAAATHGGPVLACDEEALPVAPGSLDAILSNLSLHWVNDLPGALVQARQALRPDGLFLASLLGGATLSELRTCLADAEIEITGGLSPRTSPLADVRDVGNLLSRAGFALPTVDADLITVRYESPLRLFQDLRGMGESNAVLMRRKGLGRRDVLMRAAELYLDRHASADGRAPATFEVITLTAWAPDPSQPKPLPPGSGRANLSDALTGPDTLH
ncbi:methyltransferase domain-containing protein [uncultured Rhodospira sp.]|uniref:methyltransferase domain-containing protein n=1 Tax=uncultured Rhodospira sp. TaxID=1936189 RepID=UPI00260CA256|nr:methyltransferase domain-containing protein [uncultured Rhodospira sp.]